MTYSITLSDEFVQLGSLRTAFGLAFFGTVLVDVDQAANAALEVYKRGIIVVPVWYRNGELLPLSQPNLKRARNFLTPSRLGDSGHALTQVSASVATLQSSY